MADAGSIPFVPIAPQTAPRAVTLSASQQQSLSTAPVASGSPLDVAAFTVGIWAQLPDLYSPVAHRWDEGGQSWWLGHYVWGRLSVGIAQSTSGAGGLGRDFLTTIQPGEWHFFVVTYDQGDVHLYLDGVLDDGTINGPLPTSLTGGTSPLHLGQSFSSDTTIGPAIFFDRALTGVEVEETFCSLGGNALGCSCAGGACTELDVVTMPGLVSYWPMEGSGADVTQRADLMTINGPPAWSTTTSP